MSVDADLLTGLAALLPKPPDTASREVKQKFSQKVSEAAARTLGREFVRRGLIGTYPVVAAGATTGSERRLAGGIGAKKVDVSWATDRSGLLLGVSIKSINFRDGNSGNFQKNLTNRRGDMLFESVTLHRRFPYAVLGGFLILDEGARSDGTPRRNSTFTNAGYHLRLFRGRRDPAGRDEQFEELYVVLFESRPVSPALEVFGGPDLATPTTIDIAIGQLVEVVAERNSDFYEVVAGKLKRRR
jgi:hypothetical protein